MSSISTGSRALDSILGSMSPGKKLVDEEGSGISSIPYNSASKDAALSRRCKASGR